jgi:hypothetical protein
VQAVIELRGEEDPSLAPLDDSSSSSEEVAALEVGVHHRLLPLCVPGLIMCMPQAVLELCMQRSL